MTYGTTTYQECSVLSLSPPPPPISQLALPGGSRPPSWLQRASRALSAGFRALSAGSRGLSAGIRALPAGPETLLADSRVLSLGSRALPAGSGALTAGSEAPRLPQLESRPSQLVPWWDHRSSSPTGPLPPNYKTN